MTQQTSDKLKGIFGCGVLLAFIAGALGADQAMQLAFFALGCTYGGLWMAHE